MGKLTDQVLAVMSVVRINQHAVPPDLIQEWAVVVASRLPVSVDSHVLAQALWNGLREMAGED